MAAVEAQPQLIMGIDPLATMESRTEVGRGAVNEL